MRGIKFESKQTKELTNKKPIDKLTKLEIVNIAISDSTGLSSVPVVKVGQKVLRGQLIAKANGKFSSNVHSSISGTVHLIEEKLMDNGKKSTIISILNDHKNLSKKFNPPKKIDAQSIVKAVFNAGIVGLGGAKYPTHLKLDSTKKIDHLLINGAECEDYLTCDDVLMQHYSKQILEGAKYCAKVFSLKSFTIAIQNDKKIAIEKIQQSAKKIKGFKIDVKVVPTVFPIGFEKYLASKALKLKLKQSEYPINQGVAVFNVATCFAIYEAVKFGKPLIERVCTVSGGAINNPQNFWIPTGTPISTILCAGGGEKFNLNKIEDFNNLFNDCFSALEDDKQNLLEEKLKIKTVKTKEEKKQQIKKIKKDFRVKKNKTLKHLKAISFKLQKEFSNVLSQVVAGGVMTGNNVENLDIGVSKATGGILFLNKQEADFSEPNLCIKCGKCSNVCPAKLYPNKIEIAGMNNDFKSCKKLNFGACINCGCCSFVCPAKREISYHIKEIKDKIRSSKNGK